MSASIVLAADSELPTTTIQLIGQIVTAVVAIATLVGTIIVRRDGRDVHEQTVNDHDKKKTNLRVDVDTARDHAVAASETAADIHAIVRDMQDRQIAQDAKLDAKIDALRVDLRADITGSRADITGLSQELLADRERTAGAIDSLWKVINDRLGQQRGGPPSG